MRKRFFTLLSISLLLGGFVTTHAQIQNPSGFTIEQQAKIDSLVQTYLLKGFTLDMAQRRSEKIVQSESKVATRIRPALPSSKGIWVNRDPDNPANPHPVFDTATAEDLVKNVLLSDPQAQSRITNVFFTGTALNLPDRSLAFFENGHGVGMASGLILGTNDVQGAEAPNARSGTLNLGQSVAGDPHLITIATASIHGGSILQFDFHPYAETISFDFVFASEEYPDYSNANVNDAFGFFIFEQGDPTNFTNIALFPNGDPVTINNSNWGYSGTNTLAALPAPLGDAVNPQWHVPNYEDTYAGSDSIMEYDGRTIKLKARALNLDTTKTYTLKLAICNIGDNQLGSAVFLANLDLGTPSGNIETDFDKDGGEGWDPAWDDAALARNEFCASCTQKITFDVTKHLTADRNMRFDFKPESMRKFMMVKGEAFPDTAFIPKGSEAPVVINFTVDEILKEMEGQ